MKHKYAATFAAFGLAFSLASGPVAAGDNSQLMNAIKNNLAGKNTGGHVVLGPSETCTGYNGAGVKQVVLQGLTPPDPKQPIPRCVDVTPLEDNPAHVLQVRDLPKAIQPFAMSQAGHFCGRNEGATFTQDYAMPLDMDGDGHIDYVADWDGFFCGGHTMGGGSGAVPVFILMGTAKGLALVAEDQPGVAKITSYRGYAVYQGYVAEPGTGKKLNQHLYTLRGGRATKLKHAPKGGKVAWELSR